MRILTLILSVALLFSCSSKNNLEEQGSTEGSNDTLPSQSVLSTELITTTPDSIYKSFLVKVNGIEATVYESGASFSLWEESSAQNFMTQVTNSSPQALSTHQLGHIMFLNHGEMITLAKVYENGTDVYFKFDFDGKSYYHVIAGKAKDMFVNIQIKGK